MHRDRPQDVATARFYETHARQYAQETSQLSMASPLARFTASLASGARVLDLGCGAGRDLLQFRTRGFEPVGLDLSYALVSLAHQLSSAPIVVGDMRSLPFKSRVFHGVWASASLLHLRRDELARTLKECRRVLTANAPLFTSMKLGAGEDRDHRGRFFTYVSAEEWRDLLQSNGFDVLAIDTDPTEDPRTPQTRASSGWLSAYSQAA